MKEVEAEELLKIAVGRSDVSFRDGQWEAIDALVNHRQKILVIQRTGWGKSSVYFLATKMLRDKGSGPTIIISPLLALMRNQIDAAERLGVRAVTINSTNQEEWGSVIKEVLKGHVDAILISPERLSNEDFVENVLLPISESVGLLVVDEAHCISDWGHDFRPDYKRLINILKQMPPNMPLLGTTATANDRVVEDVEEQLGGIKVLRGTLVRKSLALQNIYLPDQATRLSWLAKNIGMMPGTGIVYTLTIRDANQVAEWLKFKGIEAKAYYSGVEHSDFENSDQYRQFLETQLLNNRIKVLVATSALGMGYDKPDLGFVIHYQMPGSVVSYYQQVGRAGRAIDEAYGVLITGKEDARIHDFFRRTAFPTDKEVYAILEALQNHDGLKMFELEEAINLKKSSIEKALKVMSVDSPSPIIKQGATWYRTPVPYQLDKELINRLTTLREVEWKEMQDYMNTKDCLMAFLRKSLDDPASEACGHCANCIGSPIFESSVDKETVKEANLFLRNSDIRFKPKKQVAKNAFKQYGFRGNLPKELQVVEGRILSRWGDAGWAELVEQGKHGNCFSDELVGALTEMILKRWKPDPFPTWLTCVPSSRHPDLVPSLAKRLAHSLGVPFKDFVHKVRENEPQKMQQNRFHHCRNLDGVFEIKGNVPDDPGFLVDDIIDSGWTVTVLAALLQQAGSGYIYPVALASTTTGD